MESIVLGDPGGDNALLVRLDSGHGTERLLFDCGEGCPGRIAYKELRSIDHLFFSHFHMDHVGGFDTFFRANFDRSDRPVHVWGPPGAAEVLQHRFRGFQWNLHDGRPGEWCVHEIHAACVRTWRANLAQAFATMHGPTEREFDRVMLAESGWSVEPVILKHRGPCIGYIVRTRDRFNIDAAKLRARGLSPGPWIGLLENTLSETIRVDGRDYDVRDLRSELYVRTAGESIAYLTDFLLDPETDARLVPALRGVGRMVCEAQYGGADHERAIENEHLTVVQAASLARRADVQMLTLFHLSSRYTTAEWRQMLVEAQEEFGAAGYPEYWSMNGDDSHAAGQSSEPV